MFAIGDRVVYPMHGAGVIESIEEKKILGETRSYYILHIPHGNMQVMVPVDGVSAGLRGIVDCAAIDNVIGVLSSASTPMDDNWNRRNRANMDKLKTGDICQVAEVVRNLLRMDRQKKLSTGEKKMLLNARQILASEISLVNDIDEKDADSMIESAV
ncbi:MAG: CarD family transcriptional regulator [Firmicutes bacterium]|nr:CarD family transcriptional regulator [Bacillota bacterium]MBQ1524543.1 CarD family transcriptional regulator [Bacillota bacterium]MBQ1888766.1 CarD family transcriptional regulator [Bacillota bacterium]MBQ2456369.1 CarD family transcriptional regulator [Bacillota bacterium]MBQ3578686.1 CarD family transcriptional regulator [Bacillota bacterium]